MTRACAFRNARTDMRFRRGYADFAGGSRRARDVVAQIPGIRNLLPMVHSVRVGGWWLWLWRAVCAQRRDACVCLLCRASGVPIQHCGPNSLPK